MVPVERGAGGFGISTSVFEFGSMVGNIDEVRLDLEISHSSYGDI